MAEVPGDFFIIGTISSVDPLTNVQKVQNGPEINLTEFIRGMKFPQRLLKKTPMKKRTNRRTVTKMVTGNTSRTAFNTNPNITSTNNINETLVVTQDQSLSQPNPVPVRSPQLRTINTNSVSSPPASLEISSDESRLQRALEMSLKDSVPAASFFDFHPEVPNFSAMSGDEQMSYALKMSMQVNERDYSIPV